MGRAIGSNGVRSHAPPWSRIVGLLLLSGGTALGYAQPVTSWTQMPRPGPPARSFHAMAYDEVRQVAVLFGGRMLDGTLLGDTWEWNGAHWAQRQVDGPPPCSGHAMTYDSRHGVVVLFGSGPDFDETWEWDGTAWTQRAPAHHPAPQPLLMRELGLVYDTVRNVALLFDGSGVGCSGTADPSGCPGVTWAWDGDDWTCIATNGPMRTASVAMTFDAHRGVAVLFGRADRLANPDLQLAYSADTWEWDGTQWRCVLGGWWDRPQFGGGSALAYDSRRERVVLVDELDPNAAFGGVWEWDGATWTVRSSVHMLNYCRDQAMVNDAARGELVVCGGSFGNETWAWDGDDWAPREMWAPGPRPYAAFAYDQRRGVAVLDAGDTWEWDGVKWTFGAPFRRGNIRRGWDAAEARRMIYDEARGAVLSLGPGVFEEWDGASWNTVPLAGDLPPAGALAYDSARGVIVCFASRESATYGETWEWDGVHWTQRAPRSGNPRARFGHALAFDRARGVTVMFGGHGQGELSQWQLRETWEWDGLDWCLVSTSGPSGRRDCTLTYIPARETTVLYGGSTHAVNDDGFRVFWCNDVWEWNGAAWTRPCNPDPPNGRGAHGAVYDSARDVVLTYGGHTARFDDTWSEIDADFDDFWALRILPDGPCPPNEDSADTCGWRPVGSGVSGTATSLSALTVHNGELIVGGYFAAAGDGPARNVARWDGRQWGPVGLGLGDGPYQGVVALAVYRGELFAGGYYRLTGDRPLNTLARWAGAEWQTVANCDVRALRVYECELVVGGIFDSVGDVPAQNIARWDGNQWRPLASGLDLGSSTRTASVFALTIYDGDLIAGGSFTQSGEQPVHCVARWHNEQWEPLGSEIDGPVRALAVYNGELIAGGDFDHIGGQGCSIARWDGAHWQKLGSGPDGFYPSVRTLAVYGGELIAGGSFRQAGGQPALCVVGWNGAAWRPFGSGVNANVDALAVYAGDLFAGGTFSAAGDVRANSIARWRCPGRGGSDPNAGPPGADGCGDSPSDANQLPVDVLEPARPGCGGSPCGAAVGPVPLVFVGVAALKCRFRQAGRVRRH